MRSASFGTSAGMYFEFVIHNSFLIYGRGQEEGYNIATSQNQVWLFQNIMLRNNLIFNSNFVLFFDKIC